MLISPRWDHAERLDPEVKQVTNDAVFLIGKATELFLHYYTTEAFKETKARDPVPTVGLGFSFSARSVWLPWGTGEYQRMPPVALRRSSARDPIGETDGKI